MNPEENTRNVDTLRNVLLEELVSSYVESIAQDNGVEMVMALFEENDDAQRVAKRLRINFPSPSRVAGIVLARVRSRCDQVGPAGGDQPAA